MNSDLAALKRVLEYQWKQSLVRSLPINGLLDGIEPYCACAFPKHVTLADHELLKCIWTGTFYLNTHKAKFDHSNTGACTMC